MAWISFDSNRIVTLVSDRPVVVNGQSTREVPEYKGIKGLVGKRLPYVLSRVEDYVTKPSSELRVVLVCNWLTKCGISTYSKYLADALRPFVKELVILSEYASSITGEDGPEVDRCWNRGESLLPLADKIRIYNPDFVIIQHEFGIFPNMFYFMQLMQHIDHIPYVVTLHSVYQHLDKIVYSSAIKQILVHSEAAKQTLLKNGHNSDIFVVPHGCVKFDDVSELYNNTFNPYCVMQFGFGFAYKGVERALEAIYRLKTTDKKFENIFYIYLLSENEHTSHVHNNYYNRLMDKIKLMGLQPNVAIIRKYQTDQMLNLYLRLAKLAIFPYLNNPDNTVFAASGAIRIAMANQIPVIASESHLFDDLDGVLPRPEDSMALAHAIDEVFSNGEYRQSIIERSQLFIANHTWAASALGYLAVYDKIVNKTK